MRFPPPCLTSLIVPLLPRRAQNIRRITRSITTSASLPVQVQHVELPRILVAPGSTNHNSLETFLEYAKLRNLKPTRSVYIGTHFEYTTALALLRLGFCLKRTGGRNDLGIDLIGYWVLPQFPEPIPVIVQCKARQSDIRCGPTHIRELQGAFQGVPGNWEKKDVLALLVTSHNATSGMISSLKRNKWPMGFLNISREGIIEQFVWNQVATERGLEGVGVTMRHTPLALLTGPEGVDPSYKKPKRRSKVRCPQPSGTQKDVVLTWMGKPIFPELEAPPVLDDKVIDIVAAQVAEAVPPPQKLRGRPKLIAKQGAVTAKRRPKPAKQPVKIHVPSRRGRPPGAKNNTVLAAMLARANQAILMKRQLKKQMIPP